MLSQRLTKVFKYVSIWDPATLEIPDKLMVLYAQRRDFSLIEEAVKKLDVKPTIFHCRPLRADKEYLADNLLSEGAGGYWQIFRHHVSKADFFKNDDGTPMVRLDDDSLVDSDCKKEINRDTVQEVASVIVQKANESTKPFMMPDTWLSTRIRSRSLLAAVAAIESAKEKNTE